MKTLNRWTNEDISILKKFSKKGIKELIKRLPSRSEQAIRTKCCYLDLDLGNANTIIERVYTL